MHNSLQVLELKNLFLSLVEKDASMSARAICRAIHKPYSTLLREVNPSDEGAKLGAITLFHIMQATGNIAPLEFMAHELGYEVKRKVS